MGELTDIIAELQKRAKDNDARLVFRAETFGDDLRYAMSGENETRRFYEIRETSSADDWPEVVMAMARRAQVEWWT